MNRVLAAFLALVISTGSTAFAASSPPSVENLKQRATARYIGVSPLQWGEAVPGVRTRLDTGEKVLALTLDACGSAKGKGVDSRLIEFLIAKQIPATLFINGRWIWLNRCQNRANLI